MKYYEPCYEACGKCEYGGNNINNNCILCEFGYIPIKGINNTFNCMIKCPYYFYYTKFGQYKCSKLTVCPEDYYLLIREKDQCIEDCSKDNEYKYQYNGECFKECPENSININDSYMCLDNNVNLCSLSKKEILVKNEVITEEEIEKLAKSYLKEFFYTDNHISLFLYNNYEIAIYKNYQCILSLSLNIPSVYLGDCYEKIKENYTINDNLILAIISQRIKDINYPIIVSFFVYSPFNGNQLNISNVCQNEKLSVEEDISLKIEDKDKYYFIEYLTKQNIDVFNLSSDFYTDICFYFNSPIKKDIALKDRIKLFFPNITLCENGCTIKGINSTSMKAECNCKINNLISNNFLSNNLWVKSQVDQIEELLDQSNINILKCGSNLFKFGKISSYIGSYIMFSLLIIQIIITLLYFLTSIKPLKIYIFSILNAYLLYLKKKENNPPKKKKKVLITGNIKKGNNNTSKKYEYKSSNTEYLKSMNSNMKNKVLTILNSNRDLLKSNNAYKNVKNSKSKFSFLPKLNNNKKDKKYLNTKRESTINKKNTYDIILDDYLETDFQDMAFDEVIKREKRSFCEYFKEQIKLNLIIINVIFKNEPFRPRTIKLLLLIIDIVLYLFINALFINEEYISNLFHSTNESFFSFIPNTINRMFYASLVKVIVSYIIYCFFIEEKSIKGILNDKNNTEKLIKIKIDKIMHQALKRFIYFIIFSYIITLFILYYITCFNYRYYYITIEWIKSSIFIFISIQILNILIIFVESSLRYLSFKANSEKIYKLSLFFA